jgi:hypothetical protein
MVPHTIQMALYVAKACVALLQFARIKDKLTN